MELSHRVTRLPEYPFPRLRRLLEGTYPGGRVIDLSIGEPRHPFPDWIIDTVCSGAEGFGRYPPNQGSAHLLETISCWLRMRYGVAIDPESRLLALNGTREGLFNACLALCPEKKLGAVPYVLIPNPFYQVYAAGAVAAGAVPYFVPAVKGNGFLPDYASLPRDVLDRTALLFLCTPSNPQGAVASAAYLQDLLRLAEKHGFRVLTDECYAEIYRREPPAGTLQAAAAIGADPETASVFHSLSKRSSLPGLRSGFVAGGPQAIAAMKKLRAYAGAPIATPLLAASARAWGDEEHVKKNRALYRSKFRLADGILGGSKGYCRPEAGFFLWLEVGDGEATALNLWRSTGLRVLPGAYFGRSLNGSNPGSSYIRVALVAGEEELRSGLERIRDRI